MLKDRLRPGRGYCGLWKRPQSLSDYGKEFIKDDKGNVQKAKIVSLEPKKDEKTGRMNMVPVEGSEKVIDAQLVLIAAGFPGKSEICDRRFQGRFRSKDQCADKA